MARGPARAAAGGRDGGQSVRAGARGHACRPPAVAVIGLRRSGRTGNGESPRGRIAPACQPGLLSSHPIPVRDSAPRLPAPPAPGALRAPLIEVKIIITTSDNTRCPGP